MSEHVYSRIAGTGSYLPEKVLTNDDLTKIVETSDEWIVARTGIRERHVAAEGETTSDLAYQASLRAMEAAGVTALASTRENADYLPGFTLPQSVQIGHELLPVLMEAELVLLACPSHALRETAGRVREGLGLATQLKLVVSLAKGLELDTHLRPSEVMAATLPGLAVGTLTGPTNAAEVASGKPCAMVLAATGLGC